MYVNDSDSRLRHTDFDHDAQYAHGSPAPMQGSVGGIIGQPLDSSSEPSSGSDELDTEETTANTAVEEVETTEPLVKIMSAAFIEPKSGKTDEDIDVEAQFEYLTERTPSLTFSLIATYNGVQEVGPIVLATISEGVASATLNLRQHMEFYFTEDRPDEDKVSYSFKVQCADDKNEFISESIFLKEKPFQISIAEITDTVFNTLSPIPFLDAEGGLINTLAACFEHCAQYPDKEIICFGHTDTSGEPNSNLSLSEHRALAVKALISNDSALWRECITEGAQVIDYQTTLKNIRHYSSWDCDPGPIDGIDGSLTKQGIKQFQKNYNLDYSGTLAVDGIIGPNTWSAIQDTITAISKKQSGADPQYINPQFYTPQKGIMPCGESCPIEEIDLDGLVSINDRRVEVHFHERPNPPSLPTPEPHIDIEAIDSYNKQITDIHYISIHRNDGGNVLEIYLKGEHNECYADKPFKLVFPDKTEHLGTLDNEGRASIPIGTASEVEFYLRAA